MPSDKELTICPVYYSSLSKRFIELNRELTEKLNKRNNYVWLVGDNTPKDFIGKLDDKKFHIVRGFDQSDPKELGEYYDRAIKYTKKIYCYWHGATLNKMMKEVKSRFLLILDNNFFILRENWIDEVLDHMKKNNLGFFGVTNPPANIKKYRYFPEVHCMFIDLEKIPVAELDFMPYFEFTKVRNAGFINALLGNRLSIGVSRDVGYKVYLEFLGKIKSECVQPVIKPPPSLFRKFLNLLFPDSLSILPKRPGYYVTKSFLTEGLKRYGDNNFEEYFWKRKPFGFHLRAMAYGGTTVEEKEELFQFIKKTVNL